MIIIEIDVYSGRTNPNWIVSEERFDVFYKLYSNFDNLITTKTETGRLGYNGITVTLSPALAKHYQLPELFGIGFGEAVDYDDSIALAEFIINDLLEYDDLKKTILAELPLLKDSVVKAEGTEDEKKSFSVGVVDEDLKATDWSELIYNPEYWNDNSAVLLNNNCYAYATGKPTNSFPQPGRFHGYRLTAADLLNCSKVKQYSEIDGLVDEAVVIPESQGPRCRVALVVAPNLDYHWYREVKDSYGNVFWGHKPGRTKVTNKDNSGNIILDPKTADRGIYSLWCGYMISSSPLVEVE